MVKRKKLFIVNSLPLSDQFIERRIYLVRGQKVMLDSDLAELYQVQTKVLNQAVLRNLSRFPEDFMFRLNVAEAECLRSQIVTSNIGRGGRRYLAYAFTEHGVAMLSSVLNSDLAIKMNIFIIRAFVKLRNILATHKELAVKMEMLESAQKEQGMVLALMVGDIKALDKKVFKEFKKLKSARRGKSRIGFRVA